MVGVVSILLLCVLPAGFLAMVGNTCQLDFWLWQGGGVVHVFSVCASVCWTFADITSGGGGVVHDTVLCEYPCLLDLC